MARIEALVEQNAQLTARIAELEATLGLPPQTPDNSSTPPSKGMSTWLIAGWNRAAATRKQVRMSSQMSMKRGSLGLANTRARLRLLYADRQRFDVRNSDDGGVIAEIELPWRTVP